MYLPMTFHLESGEFSGTVAKTLERLFIDDFSLKREPIFDAKLPLKTSKVQPYCRDSAQQERRRRHDVRDHEADFVPQRKSGMHSI